jgi:hypothetical protein
LKGLFLAAPAVVAANTDIATTSSATTAAPDFPRIFIPRSPLSDAPRGARKRGTLAAIDRRAGSVYVVTTETPNR